jgi:hypothetical protein
MKIKIWLKDKRNNRVKTVAYVDYTQDSLDSLDFGELGRVLGILYNAFDARRYKIWAGTKREEPKYDTHHSLSSSYRSSVSRNFSEVDF